tara:strand:- start:127 stop:513 length:387 start_codon:yes stop_codon:yes gene_type:complete
MADNSGERIIESSNDANCPNFIAAPRKFFNVFTVAVTFFFDTKADLRSGFFTEIISDKRLWDVLRPRRNSNPVERVVRAKELIGKRFALFCSIIFFIFRSAAERSSTDYYLAATAESRALFGQLQKNQ